MRDWCSTTCEVYAAGDCLDRGLPRLDREGVCLYKESSRGIESPSAHVEGAVPQNRNKVDWRGDEVLRHTQRAIRYAIDETMSACVDDAKRNVPRVTGTLQGSIQIEPASIDRNGKVVGEWGSFDVNYALAVEMGNRSLVGPPHKSKTPGIKASGPGRNTGNRNFLRNAADKEYPKLRSRIKRWYRRG